MKKHILAVCAIAGTSLLVLNARNEDPVLMNVAGKDIHVSEFEYLYNKNNTQQAQPQTIDEYVDMFVNFKLKVAEAEAAGLDTTEAFESEYFKFRNDLAAPYMRDKAVEDSLLHEAYRHTLEDVTVSHIMFQPGQKDLADSVRQAIVNGEISYEDAARNYSIDRGSSARGGLMGMVVPGRFPWAFEEASFNLQPGEISEVVNSGVGLHLIRLERREPSKGQVHAAHILRQTRGMSDSAANVQHELIDSLYAVLTAPGTDFADVARRFSQDPGSASRGGDLGWFGPGMMVHEFDSTAFAMSDGEISEPFRTSFGYHIINRIGSKQPGTFEESADALRQMISRDPARNEMPAEAYIDGLIEQYNGKISDKGLEAVRSMAEKTSGIINPDFMAEMAASKVPAFTIGGQTTTLGELAPYIPSVSPSGVDAVVEFVESSANDLMRAKALEMARENLAQTNPDYRNLINEYRDGILLFEISNRNVWERASTDEEGLENYFRANRGKYNWDQPKYKAYVIFAQSDSALNAVMTYAQDSIPATVTGIKVVNMLRDRFGRDVKVERVIAAEGENAITDYLGFGKEKPAGDRQSRWQSYSAFRGKVIPQPEEASDVRGAVIPDYQAQLEEAWIKELRSKYPVKINKKVLNSLK